MANNSKDDKAFNDYLKGNSDISNHYRTSNTEKPPAYLDDKILSAAKKAVTDTKQKPKVVFHKSPWALPISIAAVITLSVSLVVTMQQEIGQPLIGEPESEFYDSVVLSEGAVMPKTIKADDVMPMLDETGLKQSNDVSMDYQAPAASSAIGGYRIEKDAKVLKNEVGSENKVLQIEGRLEEIKKKRVKKESEMKPKSVERRQIEEQAKRKAEAFKLNEKEQLLRTAPAAVVFDALMKLEPARQLSPKDQELIAIKTFWEQGDLSGAKLAYDEFTKRHPDVNEESIKEILGLDIYLSLVNM